MYGTSFMSASITNRPLETVLPGHGGFPSESGQEQSMVRAFICFTEAASSLERAYTQLQGEVARLRRELEVSHRELAESLEENRRMRQHLDRILENLPCGVMVVELDGRISIANPESRRVLSAISGIALEPLQPVPLWLKEWLDDLSPSNSEREYHLNGGEIEWLAARRAQLPQADGGSSIIILRDITQSRRLEQEHELLRRRQALAEMSAVLAHEIRNPLASLELFTGLLAESGLGDERQCWIEHLQAGLRMLGATVNNVLHFHSRPELELAPADLGLLLRSVAEFLQPLAQQAGVRIELAHQLDAVMIAADHHRLEQVLLNLALNAFRIMPDGGTLKISGGIHVEGSQLPVRVEIADSGCGIARDNIDRIFQPGFSTRAGSPGLGLAVAKTIVDQHGGQIMVASRPGQGTTFTVQFPLVGANP